MLQFKVDGYLEKHISGQSEGASRLHIDQNHPNHLQVELMPAASISGRVLDESGKPLIGFNMAMIQVNAAFGRRYYRKYQFWGHDSDAVTDKNGNFTIGELTPGTYYLQAYFDYSSKAEPDLIRKGYAPAYFPDSQTLATADQLCIAPGEKRIVVMKLRPQALYSLTATLDMNTNINPYSEPMSALYFENGELFQHWSADYNHSTKQIKLFDIAPGKYKGSIATGINDSDAYYEFKFSITDSNLNLQTIPLRFYMKLEATVQFPAGFKPRTTYSTLFELDKDENEQLQNAGQEITANRRVLFKRLLPGHYRIRLLTDDPLYIQSATLGSQDVLANGLTLYEPTTETFEISLARATGSIAGVVLQANHNPVENADVKLLAKGVDTYYIFKSTASNAKGEFSFQGLPPGKFNIVALSNPIPDFQFGLIEIESIQSKSQPIEITTGPANPFALQAEKLVHSAPSCPTAQIQ
jgi:protocatechuate 3,4-dioxygenase beta subunit